MISGIEIYRRTFMRQAIKYIYTKVAVDLCSASQWKAFSRSVTLGMEMIKASHHNVEKKMIMNMMLDFGWLALMN